MSIFEHQRFEIWNQSQHPYKHTLADFGYVNPALPGVTNVETAMNWILAVLYPNTKAAVADVPSLPAGGNTINDYRVVLDDGDGKAAAYRWEQREGEATPSWHKIYDMDWGQDSILAAFETQTDDRYVLRRGRDDRDDLGVVIAGVFAGQRIYGGATSGTSLTLSANSGDGAGPDTGYVQFSDQVRPTADDSIDLGTLTERFKDLYLSNSIIVDTMTISTGSIVDSTGAIDFGLNDLTTDGNITTTADVTGAQLNATDGADTVSLTPGNYTDTTGTVDFDVSNLQTTGTLQSDTHTITNAVDTLVLNPNIAGKGSIISSLGAITFGASDLDTTGDFNAGIITGTRVDADNLRLDGNTISSTDVNGDIVLLPNGTGVVDVQKDLKTGNQEVTGTVDVVGNILVDNLELNGQTLSTTLANSDLVLSPSGTGVVSATKSVAPSADNTLDLGAAALRWKDLFLGTSIKDGTNTFLVADLMPLRSTVFRDLARTIPAQTGDTIFWDAVNEVWLASVPDSEVTHADISGLTAGDAGHTQFVMLAGRAGGQVIQGGSGNGEDLVLESTAAATKGDVLVKDNFLPFTDASYSGTWSGLDLGDSTHYFRDIYTKGEMRGMRFENFTSGTLPSASAQNIGRVVFATDNNKAYVDIGTQFKVLGVSKWVSDTVWDGVITLLNVDVSAEVTDARNSMWQLRDNANNFEIMGVTILATSATNVRITTNVALPAGSYRLIGVE